MNRDLKKEKPSRPKYGMGRNSLFMIKLAWCSGEKKVIVLSLLSAFSAVSLHLMNLLISPVILSKVEGRLSVSELILTIAGFTFALMLVSALSAYVKKNEMYGRLRVRINLVWKINKKAATTSYPNIFDEKFKNLRVKAQEATSSNWAAAEAVWTTLTELITHIFCFVFFVILMSSVQPLLLAVIIVTAVISYFINNHAEEWSYRHRDEMAEPERRMSYMEGLSGDFSLAKDIRIFGLRPWMDEVYDKAMKTYEALIKKAENKILRARIIDLVLTFLRNAAAYAYLIRLVLGNELSVAEFLLYFSTVGGFTSWITGILGGFRTLHKNSLDIGTIREFLEYEELFRFEEGERLTAEKGKEYEIRLQGVSFRYPEARKDTLRNINLIFHPGEKLAIVGANGAGKTTLVKLLCGLLDPTEGSVLLNGKDIKQYNRRDYYQMFSAVFQNFSLLPGTVAVNIAGESEGIDMERVKDCAGKAGLKEKIEHLKEGYETKLNRDVFEDAVSLSGGETGKLLLARAFYKNAPFLVLDEPTAALDPIAEAEMYRKYDEIADGRSSVYISHRLASTRFCDRILLISERGIAEEGTHEELLRGNGRYAELYKIQSKYYREGEGENEESGKENVLQKGLQTQSAGT